MALFRSRDQQEVQELEKEGAKAISLQHDMPLHYEQDLENYVMVLGEERTVLQPRALEDPPVKDLIKVLLTWVNDVLEAERIIVRDIIEDMYDGQVLGELLSQLADEKINVIAVTQSAYMQRNKLKHLLERVDRTLGIQETDRKWSVQSIHSKDVVTILHLLVALARYYRCKHPLPMNVKIRRIHLKQLDNKMDTYKFEEEITGDDIGPTAPAPIMEKDVFDKLFAEAPEKLDAVKRSLCQFANKVLQEMDVVVSDIDSQFYSGVNLVLMMGLLEGYYIPLNQWHFTPSTFDERLDNMRLAFQLMADAGLPPQRAKPEDLVHKDIKATLRVLYAVFGRYKSRFQQMQQQQQQAKAGSTSPTPPPPSSATSPPPSSSSSSTSNV